MISGNIIGAILKNPDTLVLVTEDGEQHTAVMTAEEVQITATVDDVRLGKTVALEKGVKTGEKYIPGYVTSEGVWLIPNGSPYKIPSLIDQDRYDYTKLQVMICDLNTSLENSVYTHMVVINDNVYAVTSLESLSEIIKNSTDKTVDFGITNDTGKTQVLRYFTYKET